MDQAERNQRIVAQLKEWGCDIDAAMPRFLNDASFYCQLLAQLPADESFDELGTALKKGAAKEAFEKAHELKGVIANMGISPMYQTICEIVEPLRAGKCQGLDEDYARLMAEREKLLAILK
jgi:hypothetical protein